MALKNKNSRQCRTSSLVTALPSVCWDVVRLKSSESFLKVVSRTLTSVWPPGRGGQGGADARPGTKCPPRRWNRTTALLSAYRFEACNPDHRMSSGHYIIGNELTLYFTQVTWKKTWRAKWMHVLLTSSKLSLADWGRRWEDLTLRWRRYIMPTVYVQKYTQWVGWRNL